LWRPGSQKLPVLHRFHESQALCDKMYLCLQVGSGAGTVMRGRLFYNKRLDWPVEIPLRATAVFDIAVPESIKVIMPNKTNAESAGAVPAAAPVSFEGAMAELAQLVTQMEGGQLPLEASVAAYARGSELVRYCAAQLDKVEAQVKVLEGDMLKPFSTDGEDDV
jgi:exodeoxyribonuclease VII small subunit